MRTDVGDVALNGGLLAAVLLVGAGSLLIGSTNLGVVQVIESLLGHGDEALTIILYEIRLPRVLLAILVGGILGMAGAAMQGLLKNPLAEPGVIGVSASAALGAVVALYFGLAQFGSLLVPTFAMMGAFAAMLVLYAVARFEASVLTILLVGIAINSLAGALTALALNLSPNPFALSDMMLWLMGSLSNRSMSDFYLLVPFAVIGLGLLMVQKRALQAFSLGDDVASSLGIDVNRTRLILIFGTTLAVGAAVATVGTIGFIGLVIPHMIRPFVGHDPGRLLLPSFLGGSILLLLADVSVRLMPGGQELRLGVVTAMIGAPFFLYLVIATRKALQ